MENLDRPQHVTRLVAQVLKDSGWDSTDAIGLPLKTLQTACGEVQASANLFEVGSNFVISFDHNNKTKIQKELSSYSVLIPKDSDDAEIKRLAVNFSTRIDKEYPQVNDSEKSKQKLFVPHLWRMIQIPSAEYTMGCYHYGADKPFKTVDVKAHSRRLAMDEAYKIFNPSTVETVRYIETRPNPDYARHMKLVDDEALVVDSQRSFLLTQARERFTENSMSHADGFEAAVVLYKAEIKSIVAMNSGELLNSKEQSDQAEALENKSYQGMRNSG